MNRLEPPAWTVDAACDGMAGRELDPWHPDDNLTPARRDGLYAIARRVCAGCPVRLACALEALQNGLADGVWGGLTPADRRRIARERPHLGFPTPGAAKHGERSRYVAGCTAGEGGRACEPCLRAHREYERERRAIRRSARIPAAVPLLVLDHPAGSGRRRAWPGQLYLDLDHLAVA